MIGKATIYTTNIIHYSSYIAYSPSQCICAEGKQMEANRKDCKSDMQLSLWAMYIMYTMHVCIYCIHVCTVSKECMYKCLNDYLIN